ncbi:hypothetical protein ACJX0J_009870, partial [Zea mays]
GNNPISWKLRRFFSSNEKHLPAISDPEIEAAFKDLLAASWNELPDSLVAEAKKAVSKATDDNAGQEALKNVFGAAEACEEFSGTLVTLRMALDDLCGLTGENVGPLPGYIEDAVKAAYNRYMTYLESFGPEENYLRKKWHSFTSVSNILPDIFVILDVFLFHMQSYCNSCTKYALLVSDILVLVIYELDFALLLYKNHMLFFFHLPADQNHGNYR